MPSEPPSHRAPLVLITGASSGIGQALATRYAQAGYRLALLARRTAPMQAWADVLGLPASRFHLYGADVTDCSSVIAAAQACLQTQGLPEVVIACAGISIGMDSAEWDDLEVLARTFATNNVGLAASFAPFIKPMCVRGSGTLVGIASIAAIRGTPGHGAYCASKAAVVAYCESLRGELRGSGVAVVTLLPGFVDTPMTRDNPFPMPFLLSADAFASRAFKAIAAQTSYRVIPWPMGLTAKLLRLLPNPWFDRLLASHPRKPRQRKPPAGAGP
ncbi:MAG: SDR family oxidoreductase [Hydrogenophaga sp.]|nr:SDR family oxidoreductase [Hydrogenophaga sp.]